jgi:hypothetical protein
MKRSDKLNEKIEGIGRVWDSEVASQPCSLGRITTNIWLRFALPKLSASACTLHGRGHYLKSPVEKEGNRYG